MGFNSGFKGLIVPTAKEFLPWWWSNGNDICWKRKNYWGYY